jgi:hypothetical protein
MSKLVFILKYLVALFLCVMAFWQMFFAVRAFFRAEGPAALLTGNHFAFLQQLVAP